MYVGFTGCGKTSLLIKALFFLENVQCTNLILFVNFVAIKLINDTKRVSWCNDVSLVA